MGEIFQPHTSTRKWFIGLGAVLVAATVAVAVYVVFFHKSPKPAPQAYNPHSEQISSLEKSGPPPDASGQLSYYSQLGQHYEDINDRKNALLNYLKAQSVSDEHTAGRVVFYMPIAHLYKIDNNKTKAKEYYEKEITYLRKFIQDHPDQTESVSKTITTIEEEIGSL